MINAELNLVRNNPDPLAFVVAGVLLIAYELGAFVVTEDLLLGAFMVAAAIRSMMKKQPMPEVAPAVTAAAEDSAEN